TPDAVIAAAGHGVDIAGHRSRRLTAELLEAADLALVATSAHAEAIRAEFPRLRTRVWLYSELAGLRYDISDPIGLSLAEYRATAGELLRLIRAGLPRALAAAEEAARE